MDLFREIRDFADIAAKGFKVPPIYLYLDYVVPGFLFVYVKYEKFDLFYFLILAVSIVPLMVATNLFDDYFDYVNNIDRNGSPTTMYRRHPFFHYHKNKNEVLFFAIIAMLVFFMFYICLSYLYSVYLILFAILGAVLGYGYTGYPLHYKYRGMGLAGAFLSTISIPQIVNYLYFRSLSLQQMLFAVPFAVLISATLYISDYRDKEYDKSIRLKTLPVLLGKYSKVAFHILFALFYVSVLILVVLKVYPSFAIFVIITAPFNHLLINKLDRFNIKNMEFMFGNFIFFTLLLLSLLFLA
jgi:1,4-dihydroxy-2-naphthoate octaprenyltransferase